MRHAATPVALGFWLLSVAPAAGEILVGIHGGVVIPGDQDLVFYEYPAGGGLPPRDRVISQDRVDESVGPIVGGSVAVLGGSGFLQYVGLQFDALYWHMKARGKPSPPAPRFSVHQDRAGLFISVLGRVPIYPTVGRFPTEPGRDAFAYAGAGIGLTYSRISHGTTDWNPANQFLGGISVGVISNLRVRLETRYLLTGDVNTSPEDGPGWRVNTSGTPTQFRPDPHKDTRFIPVLLGIDWRF